LNNILIIYPHWPPSNLAGVHRPRLIANFLTDFDWQPIILTVKQEYYDEPLDLEMLKTVSDKVQVHYVDAYKPLKRFRFFGDIGLRSFFQLYIGALEIIGSHKIDFIWIPIPSFYPAVLGRLLYRKTKIPYGIDYIDPWLNGFVNYQKTFSKAGLSNIMAKILEPFAVKKAALISGVSASYYQPVLDRNFKNKFIRNIGMPYGFDPGDYAIKVAQIKYPWSGIDQCKPLIYAGAFLPKSHLFIDLLFAGIAQLRKEEKLDKNIHLFFVGTGTYSGKKIMDYARDHKIDDIIHEDHSRHNYLAILNYLSNAYGVMVIGSTEKHYTASKTFQSLLSGSPVFAVFHEESSAVDVLKECNAVNFLTVYTEQMDLKELLRNIKDSFYSFSVDQNNWRPDLAYLSRYSANESTRKLVEKLNEIVDKT
jgi:hypothetical protein